MNFDFLMIQREIFIWVLLGSYIPRDQSILVPYLRQKSPGDVAAFLGRDCTEELYGDCTRLMEQMGSVIAYYPCYFYFTSRIGFQFELDSIMVGHLKKAIVV
jgi:hypothetical protein